MIKNYVPFTNCISEINNTQTDKDIDIVVLMYNSINIVTIILKHLEVYGITIEIFRY